jgi:hypothetical protein
VWRTLNVKLHIADSRTVREANNLSSGTDERSAVEHLECSGAAHSDVRPRFAGSSTAVRAGAAPAEILGIEVAFCCTKCEAELTSDFRLQGRLIDCPQCGRMIEVPLWAAAEILVALNLARQQTSETRLSAEELAFLSSGGLPR